MDFPGMAYSQMAKMKDLDFPDRTEAKWAIAVNRDRKFVGNLKIKRFLPIKKCILISGMWEESIQHVGGNPFPTEKTSTNGAASHKPNNGVTGH